MQKFLIVAGAVATCQLLSGCGGGGDSCKYKELDPTAAITGKLGYKDASCAGLSSGCCKSLQAAGKVDVKKFDSDTQKKTLDAAAQVGKDCAKIDDAKAMNQCRMDDIKAKISMLAEPQQMMFGFCGFFAGAAVVGLAVSLKKRSQVALEEPLTA